MPNGMARQFNFVMEAKSVITRPAGGQQLRDPGFHEITGLAWSGRGRIRRVDVSTDGGTSWQTATLQEPVLPKCLTRFRLPWTWDGGPALLQSRAIDETGVCAADRGRRWWDVRGVNSCYHFNAHADLADRARAGRSPMWSDRVALAAAARSGDGAGLRGFAALPSGTHAHGGGNRCLEYRRAADGQGLPPGHGSVAQGGAIYAETCAACHGDKGQGGPADRLVGGFGTLTAAQPGSNGGSFWPYATTLFDFVRRAMPFNAPESLTADQVYAVSAYVLSLNGIVPDDTVLDATSLPKIAMPNRNGFTSPDPRPDVP